MIRLPCIVALLAVAAFVVAVSGLNLAAIRESMCSNGNTMVVAKAPISSCQGHCENFPKPPFCDRKPPPTIDHGCICVSGYIRQLSTDNCILPEDC